MVTIPRLDLPSPTSSSNITSSVAGASANITDYMLKQEKDGASIQKTKLNSELRVGLAVKANELKQDPAIQANPELFSEELNKYGTDYINNSTQDLSYFQKNEVNEALQSTLDKHVLAKGSQYQIKQNAVNQISNLSDIVNNSSLEAFHNPSEVSNSKTVLMNNIQSLQNDQVLTTEQGQEIARKGLAGIDRGAIEGLFDKGNLQGVEDYLSDSDVQKDLGEPALAKYKGQLEQRKLKQQKALLKEAQTTATIEAVDYALKSGIPVDPTEKNTQRSLDTYFDNSFYTDSNGSQKSLAEGVASLDVKAGSQLVNQIQRTAYIPKTAGDTLNSFILNGNVAQQTYALDMIARINENDKYGAATKFLDRKTQVVSASANRDISAGMPVSKALKIAEDKLNINKDITDFRKKSLSQIHSDKKVDFTENMKKSIETATGIDDGHWYTWDASFDKRISPIQADKALVDYQTLFDDYYMNTGDQKLATDLANKDFSRQYTLSGVSGSKRLMKYAPELYYSVPELGREQNSEWQRKQLKDEIGEATGTEIHSKNIILQPDAKTAREANTPGGKPSYVVLIKNDKGEYSELRQDGNLQRFFFDPAKINKETRDKLIDQRKKALKKRGLDKLGTAFAIMKSDEIEAGSTEAGNATD